MDTNYKNSKKFDTIDVIFVEGKINLLPWAK